MADSIPEAPDDAPTLPTPPPPPAESRRAPAPARPASGDDDDDDDGGAADRSARPAGAHGATIAGMPLRVAGVCAVFVAVFAALAWTAVRAKSPTFDEPLHALAAWLHRHTGDFRLNPEDPPLWKYWAALPHGPDALAVDTSSPDYAAVADDIFREWYFTTKTLYRTPGNVERSDTFIMRSRAMMLAFPVALAALVAWWSWRVAGTVAAVAATGALCLDPNFLGHGVIVKNDVVFTLVVFALALAIWRAGVRLTVWNGAAVCLLCGAGLTVKFSALLLGPITVLLLVARVWLIRTPWRCFGQDPVTPTRKFLAAAGLCIAAGIISYVSVWAAYGFRFWPSPDESVVLNTEFLLGLTATQDLLAQHPDRGPTPEEMRAWRPGPFVRAILWSEQSHFLPQAWLNGLLYTYQSTLARPTFLMGKHSDVGWWYYFPVAMAVKSPLALLAAMGLSLAVAVALARGWQGRMKHRDAGADAPSSGTARRRANAAVADAGHRAWYGDAWLALCLIVPPGVYFTSAVASNLNLGLRHVLPVYPFIYMGIGLAAGAAWRRRPRAVRIVGWALLIGLAVESFVAFPDYIAFFNAAAGGSRGGIHFLGDSNLDWGQDLKLLSEWRQADPGGTFYFSYFGSGDPAAYGIDYVSTLGGWEFGPPKRPPSEPGLWAISATVLQGIYQDEPWRTFFREWHRTRTPLAVLGGTIYIYEFRGRDVEFRRDAILPTPAPPVQ